MCVLIFANRKDYIQKNSFAFKHHLSFCTAIEEPHTRILVRSLTPVNPTMLLILIYKAQSFLVDDLFSYSHHYIFCIFLLTSFNTMHSLPTFSSGLWHFSLTNSFIQWSFTECLLRVAGLACFISFGYCCNPEWLQALSFSSWFFFHFIMKWNSASLPLICLARLARAAFYCLQPRTLRHGCIHSRAQWPGQEIDVCPF